MTINAHTHLYSGLVPLGMPAPDPAPENFLQILERIWWRLDRALDRDSLEASARYYVTHAMRLGCEGLVDHHESPNFIEGSLDVIADVCQDLGMPAVLCYGATERNGGPTEADRGLDECARFIRENERGLVEGVVGLHAGFTVSDGTIERAAAMARELGTVLHMHVAEDIADVEDARSRGYNGVVHRLQALDALVPGSIFAHGVHLERDEVDQVAEAGVWLVQNPRSNQGNGVGYPRYLSSTPRVALGTDGFAADMDAENAVLLELAKENGDEGAEERLAASDTLFAEVFGSPAMDVLSTGRLPLVSEEDDAAGLEELENMAREQAEKLWARMKAMA